MICGSTIKREVEKRYIGISDEKMVYHPDQPFLVIREATLEEYKEYHKEKGSDLSHYDNNPFMKELMNQKLKNGFYYEISID